MVIFVFFDFIMCAHPGPKLEITFIPTIKAKETIDYRHGE